MPTAGSNLDNRIATALVPFLALFNSDKYRAGVVVTLPIVPNVAKRARGIISPIEKICLHRLMRNE
jgi:hypothetical protein